MPDIELTDMSSGYVAPRNETEKALAAIWQELLEIEQVGIHDNFFELGGHSLLAIRLVSAIRKEFGSEFPINDVFEYPTLVMLAARLSRQGEQSVDILAPILPVFPRPEHIPVIIQPGAIMVYR